MAGVLSTVRQITSGVTSVSSGFFVDIFRYRSGQVLAASMGLIGIGYLLVSISPNYYAVLGALVVASAGSALWHPPALDCLPGGSRSNADGTYPCIVLRGTPET